MIEQDTLCEAKYEIEETQPSLDDLHVANSPVSPPGSPGESGAPVETGLVETEVPEETGRSEAEEVVEIDSTPQSESIKTIEIGTTPRSDSLQTIEIGTTPQSDSIKTIEIGLDDASTDVVESESEADAESSGPSDSSVRDESESEESEDLQPEDVYQSDLELDLNNLEIEDTYVSSPEPPGLVDPSEEWTVETITRAQLEEILRTIDIPEPAFDALFVKDEIYRCLGIE